MHLFWKIAFCLSVVSVYVKMIFHPASLEVLIYSSSCCCVQHLTLMKLIGLERNASAFYFAELTKLTCSAAIVNNEVLAWRNLLGSQLASSLYLIFKAGAVRHRLSLSLFREDSQDWTTASNVLLSSPLSWSCGWQEAQISSFHQTELDWRWLFHRCLW